MTATRKGRTRASSGPVSPGQIEREAVRLFSEKTYPVVGMRDISDAVGLLPGSLYVHIKSKEELLLKIVEGGIAVYLDALMPIARSDAPPATRLREMVLKYMEVLDSHLERTQVSVFQWRYLSPSSRADVVELRKKYAAMFRGVIEEGASSGDFVAVDQPWVVVAGIIGLLNSTMHWYHPTGPVAAREIGAQLADLVLSGLASTASRST